MGIALVLAAAALGQAADLEQQALGTIERRCLSCHNPANPTSKLDLSSRTGALQGGLRGAALVPSDPAASLLYARVAAGEMPPTGPLPEEEREHLRRWIEAGAPWETALETKRSGPRWWAWQPVQPVEGSIDQLVNAKLAEKELTANPAAGRRSLIRRLSFDLTGLPPTLEEIEAFVADANPDAYERLVDRLLASPAYGERWGRHWLDVARFGESNGYEQNHIRDNAWPYRDYVIRAFNDDKPYDQFILEQLAGDQIAPADLDASAATGFLVAGPFDSVGIKDLAGTLQKRANHLDDMIAATASGFLGLTVHCARCHDHKFDPIEQKDYYRIQAAFAGVRHGERDWDTEAKVAEYRSSLQGLEQQLAEAKQNLESLRTSASTRVEAIRDEVFAKYRPSVHPNGVEETFPPVEARFVRMTIETATAQRSVDMDEFEIYSDANLSLGAQSTASSSRIDSASPDTYAPKNLVDGNLTTRWISGKKPPAWIQIELAQPAQVSRIFWSSDRLMGFQGRFGRSSPERYKIEASLDGETWRQVADSYDRLPYREEDRERILLFHVFSDEEKQRWAQLEDDREMLEAQIARLDKPRQAFLGRLSQPEEPSYLMLRGDPMNRGEEIAPASLTTLRGALPSFELPPDAPEGARRLALAKWIASDANPLTARVIVNRIWMHHFGRPLVRNPSDFGFNGGEPSHPRLLDYLAHRLVHEHNWRLKPLHREIVTSAAYRRSSTFQESAAAIDRDAQYLWRFPPRRLSAEELRDSVLAVSGQLNREMGGPGFRLYRYTVDNVATYYPLEEFGPGTYRRSVYHQHARSVKPELLGQFDCPETSLPAPKRVTTTSPLQALALLNNSFMLDQARFLAESIGEATPTEQATRAYEKIFGRQPTETERTEATNLIQNQSLFLLCRALLNSNEFLYVM